MGRGHIPSNDVSNVSIGAGWLEFSRYPGLTEYELGSYIGALIGILVATPSGFMLGQRLAGQAKAKKVT